MIMPVFAYGTYEKLVQAIEDGKIGYPTYAWLSDTTQYAFVNKSKQIEIMGVPRKTGTLDNQIILANLNGGIYLVKGQYKITESSETTYLASSEVLVVVQEINEDKKVRVISGDSITDYNTTAGEIIESETIVTDKYLEEHGYLTEEQADAKFEVLAETLKEDMEAYVDTAIEEQLATSLPEELDKLIEPTPSSDIDSLFDGSYSI